MPVGNPGHYYARRSATRQILFRMALVSGLGGVARFMRITDDEATPLSAAASAGRDATLDSQRAFLVLLFNKYRGALLRHVERMVHSREDAAELVQETYLRVMHRVQASRFEAAARSYLFQTATNLARDHHRRRRFRAHECLDEMPEAEIGHGPPSPDQLVSADQVLGRLRDGVQALPPLTRSVFLRARLHNEGYAQIAASHGLSVRTVERHMAEAMAALRRGVGELP